MLQVTFIVVKMMSLFREVILTSKCSFYVGQLKYVKIQEF